MLTGVATLDNSKIMQFSTCISHKYTYSMFKTLIDIGKNMSSMLRSGAFPPGASPEARPTLENINFLTSKKFFVVFCSIIILGLFYGISVLILFLFSSTPNIVEPFVVLFTKATDILAIIVGTFLGVQTVLDFKYNSNTEVKHESITETSLEEKRLYIDDSRSKPDFQNDSD